ncbi:MAG: SpoIIE family protein phosphatase [Bacteroidales bacterium]|nr:SpoIIE family protein phosphatase [Bacteroidales bacterium]
MRQAWKKSFAIRVSLYILPFVSLLIAAILIFYYFFSRGMITDSAESNAGEIAQSAVNRIEQVLVSVEKVTKSEALFTQVFTPDDAAIRLMLSQGIKSNPEIFGGALAFEPNNFNSEQRYYAPYAYRNQDTIQISYLGNENYEYFYMDWYQIPFTLNKAYWTEPYYDKGGGNILMSSFSIPFYKKAESKSIAGIATSNIALDWLTAIVDSIQVYETGYAFLISRTGTLISHPAKDKIMHESIFSLAKEMDNLKLREIGRAMINGESDLVYIDNELFPESWLYYLPFPSNGWSLGIVFPDSELFASLKKMNASLIFLGLIGFSLLCFIIFNAARRVTVPLRKFAKSAREIAEGKFDTTLPEIKTQDEMGQLYHAFEYLRKELGVYIENLKQTTADKEKIESELRIANEIQMGMVPKLFPPFPDRNDIDIYALLEPAKEVGGDLYDFFFIDDNKLCFAVGDVSGKGVPAALFMVVTRTLLRSSAIKDVPIAKIVQALNDSLSQDNEAQMFVTFFLGILDLETGDLEYVNAGHNPPVILTKTKDPVFAKMTGDMALGFMENQVFKAAKIKLKTGDTIFSYTDGVTEAANHYQELYSDERLLSVIKVCQGCSAREIIEKMYQDINLHASGAEQSDDITMLAIKYRGPDS